jgi:hypothetical protein
MYHHTMVSLMHMLAMSGWDCEQVFSGRCMLILGSMPWFIAANIRHIDPKAHLA